MKKVLLVVIDALTARVVAPAMERGELPTMTALRDRGVLREECSVVFPSITPAATSAIITGEHPSAHGIAGAYWYEPEHDDVVYYGADFWALLHHGVEKFFKDFAYRMNHDRLHTTTLFQRAEQTGMHAACLNYLIFRGDVRHKLSIPFLMSLIPGVPSSQQVQGPTALHLGTFVSVGFRHLEDDLDLDAPEGWGDRFGMNDAATGEILRRMARSGPLPDLTVAYFPDNDFRSHEVGPEAALPSVRGVDATLGAVFDSLGGIDRALEELCVVVVGDHSQCEMLDGERASILLDEILGDYSLADAGTPWTDDDQIMACPDLRVAHIYFHELSVAAHGRVVRRLLADDRVDQVLWRADLFDADDPGLHVATADRGELYFRPGDGEQSAVDRYGGRWSWRGDLSAVDGRVEDDGALSFGDYPNAFERINGGLHCPNSGEVWATARPGYEFRLPRTTIHHGGSHGTLHRLDSLTALLVAGAPADVTVPAYPRTLDVAPICLAALGLDSPWPVGVSRWAER